MNRILKALATAAVVALAAVIQTPYSAKAQRGTQFVVVDIVAVAEGYRASKLNGSSVVNDANERIGTVDDIIIGRDRVLFAVLQVGGFLGLGGKLVAVPYQSLALEAPGGKITLPGATKDELKKLPEFKYK